MEVSGKLHAPAALSPGTGGWVGPRSGLDAVSFTPVRCRSPSLYRQLITSRKVTGSSPDDASDFFSIDVILPAAVGHGVCSAPHRNEYQKMFLGIKGGRCVRLTTSRSSVSHCLENVGASTSHNPTGLYSFLLGPERVMHVLRPMHTGVSWSVRLHCYIFVQDKR
jgi:hypothetical protein